MKTDYMISGLTIDPNERILLIKRDNGLSDVAFDALKKALISSAKTMYTQVAELTGGLDYGISPIPEGGELSIRVRRLPFIRYEKDEINLLDIVTLRKIHLEQSINGRQFDAVICDGGYRLTVSPNFLELSKVYPSSLDLLQALSDLDYEIRLMLLNALARRTHTLSLLDS